MDFNTIIEKAKIFYEANKKMILIVAGIIAAVLILPKVLKMLKPRVRRRRPVRSARVNRRRSYTYRPTSKRPPKGSAAMRRRMARIRSMRRK